MIKKNNTVLLQIKRMLLILKIKWVKGECRRLCLTCKYKNQCYDNLEL